jgi:ferredoxin
MGAVLKKKGTFVIDADACTECEGEFDVPQCEDVCPVPDCIIMA